jgi:hypothetical protein
MKLSKEGKTYFDSSLAYVNHILVSLMVHLKIPNFVESTSEHDGFEYTLTFTREKINK